MNKKLVLATLIFLNVLSAGCGQNGSQNTVTQGSKETQIQQSNCKAVDKAENSTVNKDNATNNNGIKKPNQAMYELTKKIYKSKNITINYPQIINLGDDTKQTKINNLIKNEALSYVANNIDNNSSLEVSYNVTLKNSDLLSIEYSGVASLSTSMHPSNIFYTTNIDIKDRAKLRLKDFVKIDGALIEAFKKGKYVDWQSKGDSKISKELQDAAYNYVSNIDTNELIKDFNEADSADINKNPSSTFSYLSKDSIFISINVPHAIGDHAEYEINLKNIQSNIKYGALKK